MTFLLVNSKDVYKDPATGKVTVRDRHAAHMADIIMFVDEANNHETYIIKNKYGLCGKITFIP